MPQGALDGVQLHLVSSLAGLDACRRWAGERRETPLFADTESGGLSPFHHRHRMTQLGDMRHGWAFPPAWAGAAVELLMTYRGQVGFHNSPYDWRVLAVHQGVTPAWHKTEDTLLLGHIADSLRLAGLKDRSAHEVDSRARRAEDVLKEGMRARHWTYDDVPDTWEPYWRYGALAPVLAAHLWNLRTFRQARSLYAQAYDLERATARICVNMMMAGMAIDEPFIRARISEIEEYTGRAGNWLHREFGIGNVRSGPQVVAAMRAAGIATTVLTEKGRPSIGKEALKFYRLAYPEHTGLLNAVEWCRKGDKLVGSYLAKFLELRSGGVMHYNIHSCKARTSRMSITDPPMQTFDRDVAAIRGSFVPREGCVLISLDMDQVEARLAAHFSGDTRMIGDFRYADANNLKFFIEMASRIYAERITKKDPRYTWTKNACVPLDSQILTRRGWLRYDQVTIGDETPGLNLVTGRSEWTPVTGVHVYQDAPVQSIGNNDRFRLRATTDHKWPVQRTFGAHRAETRLLLAEQGELNRHRDSLVLAAPLEDQEPVPLTADEARVLGWLLSDGRLRVNYQEGGSAQAHGQKRAVTGEIFQTDKKYAQEIRFLLRNIPHHEQQRGDGYMSWRIRPGWLRDLAKRLGIYDQRLAPEALACSLSRYSRRIIAETMRKADGDPFVKGDTWRAEFYAILLYLNGETPVTKIRDAEHSAWQKEDCWSVSRTKPVMTCQRLTREDLPRQPVWCVTTGLGTWTMRQGHAVVLTGNTYGQIYGAGLDKAAATAGVPVETMRPAYEGLASMYPGVGQLMNRLIRSAENQRPKVQILDGRWLYTYRGKEYALLNTLIQGSAAVIMKRGLINLDAAGFGSFLRLPVHDEILLECPAEIASDVLREAERILTDRENFAVPLTWSGSIMAERWEKRLCLQFPARRERTAGS